MDVKDLKDAAYSLHGRARNLDGELEFESDASSVMSLLIETIGLVQSLIRKLEDAPPAASAPTPETTPTPPTAPAASAPEPEDPDAYSRGWRSGWEACQKDFASRLSVADEASYFERVTGDCWMYKHGEFLAVYRDDYDKIQVYARIVRRDDKVWALYDSQGILLCTDELEKCFDYPLT